MLACLHCQRARENRSRKECRLTRRYAVITYYDMSDAPKKYMYLGTEPHVGSSGSTSSPRATVPVLVDTRVYSTQFTSRVLPSTSRTSYSKKLQLLPLLSDLSQAYLLQ